MEQVKSFLRNIGERYSEDRAELGMPQRHGNPVVSRRKDSIIPDEVQRSTLEFRCVVCTSFSLSL